MAKVKAQNIIIHVVVLWTFKTIWWTYMDALCIVESVYGISDSDFLALHINQQKNVV